MTMTLPKIILVDDHPEELIFPPDWGIRCCPPNELSLSDVEGCDLVLVDFNLADWADSPKNIDFARDVRDGLALAGVIAGALRERGRKLHLKMGERSPTAIAVITAEIELLLPPETEPLPYLAARAVGVEWIFQKTHEDWPRKAVALAKAVQQIPRRWDESAETNSKRLLALPEGDGWQTLSWESVLEANPPIHEISRWTDGLAFIRWLAHRVLPYPSFVWSTQEIAKRLQISHKWVQQALHNGLLGSALEPAHYQGALSGLFEPRWWSAGVEHIIRSQFGGVSPDRAELISWLSAQFPVTSEDQFREKTTYVPCIDAERSFEPELVPIDSCVRVRVDDWPSYAHEAWMRIETIKEYPRLLDRVYPQDRGYLGSEETDK
jgi:hypothetical protein